MKYHLTDIYNIEELRSLCKSFTDITGVVTALLDLEGNVHVATGWKSICTKFHRACSETAKRCRESDTTLAGQLQSGNKYNIYKCKNGLIDVAMPIIVGDNHVGNFFTGQFLTEEPDIEYFRKQAQTFGFDEKEYLEALAEVPVFTEQQIKANISFLVQLTEIVGNIGLKSLVAIEHGRNEEIEKKNLQKINEEYEALNKEYQEVNEELITAKEKAQKSEKTYRMLFQNLSTGFALHEIILDSQGKPCDYRFLEINPAFEILTGLKAKDIIGKTVLEVMPGIESAWVETYGNVVTTGKSVTFENYSKVLDKYYHTTAYSPEPGKFATIFLDITERKKVEEELRDIESRFEEAERDALLGHWTLNLLNGELSWSKQVFQIFEINPEQFEAKYDTFLSFVHPDDHSRVNQAFTNALENHSPYEITHRLLMADGRIKWVCEKCTFDFNAESKPLRALGIVQDITDRKQAEEALLASEEDLKESQRIAHVGSWHLDIATNQVEWSEELYRMYGYDPTKPPPPFPEHEKLFTPDSWQQLVSALEKTAAVGEPYELVLKTVRPDGTNGWMWVYGRADFDDNGKIVGLFGAAQDITERKLSEQLLRAIEARNKSVIQTAMDGFWRFDLHGNLMEVNAAYCNMSGYSESELLEMKVSDFEIAESPKDVEGHIQILVEKGEDIFVSKHRHKSGKVIDVEICCQYKKEEGGYCVAFIRDITERIKIEEARQKFVMLADSSSDFIGMCDLEFNPYYVNQAGLLMVGLPNMEAAFKTKVKDFFFPEDQQFIVDEFFPGILKKGEGAVEIRLRNFQTGEPIWVYYYVFSLRDVDGNTIGWATVSRNISERKQAEDEIRKLNAELEQRVQQRTEELENKNVALENAIAKLQETQSQLILFEKMTVLRHLISGIAHEINNPLGAIDSSRELLESGIGLLVSHISDIAGWLNDTDGTLLAELIENAGAGIASAANLSFSEKRKCRSKIIELLTQNNIKNAEDVGVLLIELNICENVERFFPLLRHENIIDKLRIIRSIVDSYVACNTIKTAVGKSAKIVNALRSYARKEGDTQNKVVSDIREGLETVLSLFQNTFKFFVNLDLDFDDDVPAIKCFPDQLNQVWTNIIQNALHAMGNSGTLNISVRSQDGGVLVKVADHGCGMSPEVQARIFEPLFTTKPAGEGIGLGMDIVHMIIVERHNGRIDIDSEVGKGTTISVFLPVC